MESVGPDEPGSLIMKFQYVPGANPPPQHGTSGLPLLGESEGKMIGVATDLMPT